MSSTGGSNRSKSGSKPSKGSGKSTTGMIRWPTDFLDFLKLLDRHKVKYVIVGGYAVGFHQIDCNRATGDIASSPPPPAGTKNWA